ncbi:hypothetical protein JEQ12_014476 [Ovis aries]|uniref:dihydrofolate reductase n=1 Tax=Ovis aries TaxID=9940 RepID=A0A836D7V2_SHEEP|nr:hypothetical protein JEQ12_014476 [Ovis aries]
MANRHFQCSIPLIIRQMEIKQNKELPTPVGMPTFSLSSFTFIRRLFNKQNLVIMGRKRWFNTPEKNQSLKDRFNIILNRELKEPPQGAHFLAKSLDDALEIIVQPALTNKLDMEEKVIKYKFEVKEKSS